MTRLVPPLVPALLVLLLPNPPAAADDDDELPPPAQRTVDFARDIQPILVKRCYECHAKQRKGGLRLDRKADALAGGDSGPFFEPGKSAESDLIYRVAGLEPTLTMPPKGDPLTPEQVGLLRAWIDQGAKWPDGLDATESDSTHWAFRKVRHPEPPTVADPVWARNPIDRFVLARLDREGLHPSPEADRITLVRRLSLDLLGLPPSIEDVDAFCADERPDAYERLVDRLLASPHYGERWGRRWLDSARYADTNGYEKDRARSIWPYRDWVINAFNADLPFDRFTIEQIAGDMLPTASLSAKVATGFHRNTMTNEEGGIDVEEFRYVSLVDRVATTGAVWLGLTIGCAQCHTHKYDPITQREYYRFMAFFNNADELDLEVPSPVISAKRATAAAKIAALEAALPDRFPTDPEALSWTVLGPVQANAADGARLSIRPDGSVWARGAAAKAPSWTFVVDTPLSGLTDFRVESVSKPPTEGTLRVQAAPLANGAEPACVELAPSEGSEFHAQSPVGHDGATRLTFTWERRGKPTDTPLGLRLWAKRAPDRSDPIADPAATRRNVLDTKQAVWEAQQVLNRWVAVSPSRVLSRKNATMTLLEDQSVLVSGDKPNNDVYEVELPIPESGVTAFRLEVLPHPSHPQNGPGRAPLFSEGDFILTRVEARLATPERSDARALALRHASEDFSEPGKTAALAIDDVPESGWTIKGGVGKPHQAVFEFAEPITAPAGSKLLLTLHQFGIHQMTIGRFRIALTRDPAPVRASALPDAIQRLIAVPPERRDDAQRDRLRRYYLSVAPELAAANAKIAKLRDALPEHPTTLVMQERGPAHHRTTNVHQRGEYLKLGEEVAPGVPEALHPLPEGAPLNRLTLARWLVSEENPLVARVVVNRIWQGAFGRGLVATTEDFGTRGEPPTHPELLDWLAAELMGRGWGLKAIHRLIVTSATYRQSSEVTPELLARDPNNLLLARGARFRVEAEIVRDLALSASGLLSTRIGGPSVYPPLPEGVLALAYGKGSWPESTGPDRYRRGIYTFTKRTAPYAAFAAFDMPSSETACVRRERSNTPLQALTLLNDAVFVEAAQALARRALAEAAPTTEDRIRHAFRLGLARPPKPRELQAIQSYYDQVLKRFRSGELDPKLVAGPVAMETAAPIEEQAALAAVTRAILNLDETITRE